MQSTDFADIDRQENFYCSFFMLFIFEAFYIAYTNLNTARIKLFGKIYQVKIKIKIKTNEIIKVAIQIMFIMIHFRIIRSHRTSKS